MSYSIVGNRQSMDWYFLLSIASFSINNQNDPNFSSTAINFKIKCKEVKSEKSTCLSRCVNLYQLQYRPASD